MRTDTALIKHLSQNIGLAAGQVYNRLGLFLMAEESDSLYGELGENLLNIVQGDLQMPFSDFILDIPFGMETLYKITTRRQLEKIEGNLSEADQQRYLGLGDLAAGLEEQLWVRLRRVDKVQQDMATLFDVKSLSWIEHKDKWMLAEIWEKALGKISDRPHYVLIPLSNPIFASQWDYYHIYKNKCSHPQKGAWCRVKDCSQKIPIEEKPGLSAQERELLAKYKSKDEWTCRCSDGGVRPGMAAALTVLCLAYLNEGFGGLMTEITQAPRTPKEKKAETKKPWVAPRRSTFIIVDPERAHEYGHPSSQEPIGSQRSPKPHARRGHFRRLPKGRVWVRPTWVGLESWEHEGRTYKVRIPSKK